MSDGSELTPKEITRRLDEYIVGQQKAKRAVAVALRNRWRRRQLPPEVARDVYPKNILLIGPTGVGKTEIARRLAHLARAPFVKVEATKYSEVGYHGRDVESMIRDLVDAAVALVREERAAEVRQKAEEAAEERIFRALLAAEGLDPSMDRLAAPPDIWRPASWASAPQEAVPEIDVEQRDRQRARLREMLGSRQLEDRVLEIELRDTRTPTLSLTGPQGNETMGIDAQALQEIWGRSPVVRMKVRKLKISEARALLREEEADRLLDMDAVVKEALDRAQNDGILFIDEIDKIISAGHSDGPDVSREGVQRDLLSIVEGCAVFTRYGHVRTDHVLFLAAGAFHFHKPSELIPELQGRFPVRVALRSLTEQDFVRILKEPRNSLLDQYRALFSTEDVTLRFSDDGVARIAELAFRANKTTQDIGARRLMTMLEKCLEDLSFEAAERGGSTITVDRALVDSQLGESGDDEDLMPYDL
ncbi:MAG: ATP-dependent protease ATPase subunit HslU [Planctomycetota bacterium]